MKRLICIPDKIWLAYLLLSIMIFLPLLNYGYIQTFDMAWGPLIPQTTLSDNTWLLSHVLSILSALIGSMFVQKLLLVGLFVLAGVGAHRLSKQSKLLVDQPVAAYLAGVLYMVNPFIYTRLMAGQWLVLFGYALLPWTINCLWQLMQTPRLNTALRAMAWMVVIGLTSIHALGFTILAGVCLFIVAGTVHLRQRLVHVVVAAFGWGVMSTIWLIPSFMNNMHIVGRVMTFGTSQMHAFMTSASIGNSTLLTTLSLQGFWADGQGRYVLPSSLGIWFYCLAAILGLLILYGAVRVVRYRDRLGIALIIIGLIAWWLAMGIGSSWSAGATNWLVDHVPLYRGYREPQKWLMLLVIAYAYLAAMGLGGILIRLRHRNIVWRQFALGATLLLPLLVTPMLLYGAGGQLYAAPYPSDYAKVAKTLNAEGTDYKVLVLPWHMYLPLSYAKRVVANPAEHYFQQQMITGDNPELAGVVPTQQNKLYALIDNQLLPQRLERTDAVAQLGSYDVHYVLLLKEADWQRYRWLDRQIGLRVIQDSANLRLYHIEKEKE